ncbi:MAG TPA: 50S ribosomal protein L9, partial [Blastocatellia bacterium]
MPLMELLLKEDVDNLGARGDLVKVKPGYGRNYLLPRGLAIQATPGNKKQIELQRKALLKKEAVERDTATQQADLLKEVVLEFSRKVGEHGILYGSVTSMDIAEA